VTVTPQLRSYWSTCHATHRKVKPACNQICNKNYTDETRHQTQPPQIFEQYFWWCAGFCLPTKELLLLVLSRLDVVFLCIHCMVQNTNQHSFLIYAGPAYTICVLFLFYVVDGATPKRMVWRVTNASLKDGAGAFMLFLHGAQLVLQSNVLAVLDLDGVDFTLENAEMFGLVLFGKGGSAGGWRCFCQNVVCFPCV